MGAKVMAVTSVIKIIWLFLALLLVVILKGVYFYEFDSWHSGIITLIVYPLLIAVILVSFQHINHLKFGYWKNFFYFYPAVFLAQLLSAVMYFKQTEVSIFNDPETMAVEQMIFILQLLVVLVLCYMITLYNNMRG